MSKFTQNPYSQLEERVGSRSLYVEMREKKGSYMPHFHYHSSFELFYIKSGTATFIIGNKSYTVYEGSLLIIPPYVPHKSIYAESQDAYRIELQIKSSFLTPNMSGILDNLSKHVCYTLSLKYQTYVIKLLTKMKVEFNSKREYSEDLCLAFVNELLITVYRNAVKYEPSSSNELLPEKIMKYITENYYRNITISELSDQFHICESTIFKSFKKNTGLKVTDYINFTRIMNAERLMRETDLTLTEISYRCGFNNFNYFCSVFKRYKNTTPGKFMHQKRVQ